MQESDIPFIRQALVEIFQESTFEGLRPYLTQQMVERKSFQGFSDNIRNDAVKLKVLVATFDDGAGESPVGFVSVGEQIHPDVDLLTGKVFDLFVSDQYRNKGIGSRLLDYGLEYLKNLGLSFATINTAGTNDRALHLYRKKGFKPDDIRLIKQI